MEILQANLIQIPMALRRVQRATVAQPTKLARYLSDLRQGIETPALQHRVPLHTTPGPGPRLRDHVDHRRRLATELRRNIARE